MWRKLVRAVTILRVNVKLLGLLLTDSTAISTSLDDRVAGLDVVGHCKSTRGEEGEKLDGSEELHFEKLRD